MNEEVFGDIAIEKACKERFGVQMDVTEVIVRGIPAGPASQATIFKSANGQVWLFVVSQSPLVLDDIQKIVNRMNLEAEIYVPPHGESNYFTRIGSEKFKAMFPGKPIVSEEDLRYYKKLAPYNPALVRLSRIKGEIRGYETQSKSWHKVKDFAFSKIKTI